MSFDYGYYNIHLIMDTRQVIKLVNNIIKNLDIKDSILEEKSIESIGEIVDILKNYIIYRDFLVDNNKIPTSWPLKAYFNHSIQEKNQYSEIDNLEIDTVKELPNGDWLLSFNEHDVNYQKYSWEEVISKIDVKCCIIDEKVYYGESIYVIDIDIIGTRIISKKEGYFSWNYFPFEEFDQFIRGSIIPKHFALLKLAQLNEVINSYERYTDDYPDFIEEGKSKAVTVFLESKREIEDFFGFPNDENLLDNLSKREYLL